MCIIDIPNLQSHVIQEGASNMARIDDMADTRTWLY